MKKIALCIPTYNEADNIAHITSAADNALKKYKNKYDCVIVNCDNNSIDNTNKIFEQINTHIKKISIISLKKGKGNNILNFLKYCKENNVDYAITIDADLKSFETPWLDKMIFVLENNCDFVIPNYYRPVYEGNTTNHFIVPILYNLYGLFIRQPIGGDYAFNRKYINLILQKNFTKNILDYGIDIFMVIIAITNGLNICQIDYGTKVHSDSYKKIKKIFRSVVYGLCEVYKQCPPLDLEKKLNYNIKLHKDGKFKYREYFEEDYEKLLNKYNLNHDCYEKIKKKWIYFLTEYIKRIPNLDENFMNTFEEYFLLRSVSFWDKYDNDNMWENEIINLASEVEKEWN